MNHLPTQFTGFKDEDFRLLAERLHALNEVDISDYLETLPATHRFGIFRLLDKEDRKSVV